MPQGASEPTKASSESTNAPRFSEMGICADFIEVESVAIIEPLTIS